MLWRSWRQSLFVGTPPGRAPDTELGLPVLLVQLMETPGWGSGSPRQWVAPRRGAELFRVLQGRGARLRPWARGRLLLREVVGVGVGGRGRRVGGREGAGCSRHPPLGRAQPLAPSPSWSRCKGAQPGPGAIWTCEPLGVLEQGQRVRGVLGSGGWLLLRAQVPAGHPPPGEGLRPAAPRSRAPSWCPRRGPASALHQCWLEGRGRGPGHPEWLGGVGCLSGGC